MMMTQPATTHFIKTGSVAAQKKMGIEAMFLSRRAIDLILIKEDIEVGT
jgi:hypothetical protein